MTIFSQRIHPMLLQEIFQTPFSNNNDEKKRKTYRPVARQKHTRYANSSTLNLSIRDWNDLPQEIIKAKAIDTFVSRAPDCSNLKHVFVVVVVLLLTLRKVTK